MVKLHWAFQSRSQLFLVLESRSTAPRGVRLEYVPKASSMKRLGMPLRMVWSAITETHLLRVEAQVDEEGFVDAVRKLRKTAG